MMESRRLASRQLWPICVAGSKVATATPPALPSISSGIEIGSPGMKDGAIERGETFGRGGFVGERAAANALAKIAGIVPIGDAEARLHQRRRDPLQIRRPVGRQGKPLRLRLLQRDIPGDDFGDAARLGPGGAVAVKQGVGRDSEEANRRQRRDAQRQPQLQIDGARGARHGFRDLLQAPSHFHRI